MRNVQRQSANFFCLTDKTPQRIIAEPSVTVSHVASVTNLLTRSLRGSVHKGMVIFASRMPPGIRFDQCFPILQPGRRLQAPGNRDQYMFK